MYRKKKCEICGKKSDTTGARVIPGRGRVECCDNCKNFLDGPGDNAYNPATIKVQKPMGSGYHGPEVPYQKRR